MARSKRQEGVSIWCPWKTKALTDLPAGITGESSDLHAMWGAARPRRRVAAVVAVSAAAGRGFTRAGAARELDRETFSHEVGSVLRVLLISHKTEVQEDWGLRGVGVKARTYGKLERGARVSRGSRAIPGGGGSGSLPGTTSRASMASLYSMKPKPFISLISVISPVPWVAKCASTSALVAGAGVSVCEEWSVCEAPRGLAQPCRAASRETHHSEAGCPGRGG